jgi:hypothetical protein
MITSFFDMLMLLCCSVSNSQTDRSRAKFRAGFQRCVISHEPTSQGVEDGANRPQPE